MKPNLEAFLWTVAGGAATAIVPLATAGLDGSPVDWHRMGSAAICGAFVTLAALLRNPWNKS